MIVVFILVLLYISFYFFFVLEVSWVRFLVYKGNGIRKVICLRVRRVEGLGLGVKLSRVLESGRL